MQIISIKNEIYTGASGRASLYDLTIPKNWNHELIIFCHGYMGYKDWGAWNLMESFFVERGFGFLKYNVSHNGGTVENGIDFPDLRAFGENAYSKELTDMERIIQLARKKVDAIEHMYLVGHSRGGGMVLLQSKHPMISKIVALAPISDIGKRFPTDQALQNWEQQGVYYKTNGRTHQEMPHSYSQYIDYLNNKDRLDIEFHCRNARTPIYVIHGEEDTSVRIEEGETVATWANATLVRLPNEQHTFGAKQPWTEPTLPVGLQLVCAHILRFISE